MTKTVVGLFTDFDTAEKVVRDLQKSGFTRDDISLMARDQASGMTDTQTSRAGTSAGEGAAAGAGTGAMLGGLAGLLVGLGALAIPGIGPIIAAGPLATALAGAGIGAAAGGVIGALVGAGVPEEDANAYAEGVRRGGTLVMVRAADHMADQARDIMDRYFPIDVTMRSQQWRQNNWTGFDAGSMPLGEAYIARERESWRSTGTGYGQTSSSSTTGSSRDRGFAGMQRDFNDYSSDFRSNYSSFYGNRGREYGYYEPAYRYGYDLGGNEQYRGRRWNDIEADARRDWERSHPANKWEDVKDAVRHAWERVTMGGQADTAAGSGYTGHEDY